MVEGVGDHGCEYMTGGRVVILGSTGRNFAAGMSGEHCLHLGPAAALAGNCNAEMVDLDSVENDADEAELTKMIKIT